MATIPGISHIIALKNIENEKTFLTYDCVLCNPSGELLRGSTMKTHLQTREHLLNVLEVENFPLYKKFKNDYTVSSIELLHEINGYEPFSNKRIVATKENHAAKRKEMEQSISGLRRENAAKYCNENAKSSDNEGIINVKIEEATDIVSSSVEVNSREIIESSFSHTKPYVNELAAKQSRRCPKHIVFAVDGRDFSTDKECAKQVKIVRSFKLTFDNALSFFEKHEVLNKGSVIIFCCGIYSLLSANVINICKKMKCANHVIRYILNNITSDDLISKALTLQEYILEHTVNDQLLLCEIVPINVNAERMCANCHMSQNSNSDDAIASYMKTIEEYNKFVRYHSLLNGFRNMELVAGSFSTTCVSLSADCFNKLGEIDTKNVSRIITQYIIELLHSMKMKNNTTVPVTTISYNDDPQVSKVAEKSAADKASAHMFNDRIPQHELGSTNKLESNGKNSNTKASVVIKLGKINISGTHTNSLKGNFVECRELNTTINIKEEPSHTGVDDTINKNPIQHSGSEVLQYSDKESSIKSETASVSEKSNCLPGLSYIIALKSTSNETNSLKYDCVLCNLSTSLLLRGTAMKLHMQTREHILNVMEIENFSLYEKYKHRSDISPLSLFKEACSNERGSGKRVIATLNTYEERRKQLISTISQLQANINQKHSSELFLTGSEELKNIDASSAPTVELPQVKSFLKERASFETPDIISSETSDIICLETSDISSDIIKEDFRQLYEKYAYIQKKRCPTKIVFLLDGRDIYLDTEQPEDVKVARSVKLSFDNAIFFLEKLQILGQGSLIIFCCGIFSVLTANVINICKKKKCPNHLFRYSQIPDVTSRSLISKALSLQEFILNNTINDQVMFCELVPINISSDGKKCGNNHSLQNEIPNDGIQKYLKTVEEYNNFVTEHSRSMGFKNLDILKHSFPSMTGNILSPDSLNVLDEMDKGNVAIYISVYIKELLLNMKDGWNKQSEIFDLTDEPSNENSNSVINISVNENAICNTSSSLCQGEEHLDNSCEVNKYDKLVFENENIDNESIRINQPADDEIIILTAKSSNKTVVLEDTDSAIEKDGSALEYITEETIELIEDKHTTSEDSQINVVTAATRSDKSIAVEEQPNSHFLKVTKDNIDSDGEVIGSCEIIKTQNKTSAKFEPIQRLDVLKTESISVESTMGERCQILRNSSKNIELESHGDCSNNQTINSESEFFSTKEDMKIADSNLVAEPAGISNCEEWKSESPCTIMADISKFVNIQKVRCPTKIVFLLDGRDFYLENEQPEDVKVARSVKLSFDNAISFLEKQQILGKGSLIIFCCGIFSVLTANVINVCKKKKCPNPLLRYSLLPDVTSRSLISKALSLQEYILNNTINDQVMFCELVPINTSSDGKKCGNNHCFQNEIPNDRIQKYLKAVEEYNNFVTEHSRSMGFKNLDILKHSFPSMTGNILSPDSLNVLDEMDKGNVAIYISVYIKELLLNIKDGLNKQSEIFDLTDEPSNENFNPVNNNISVDQSKSCYTSSSLSQDQEHLENSCEVNKYDKLVFENESILINQPADDQIIILTAKSSSKTVVLEDTDSAIEKDGSAFEYITEETIELIEDKHATSEDSEINVVTVATRSDTSIAVEEEPNLHFLKVTKDNIDSDGEVIGSCEIIKTQNKTSAKFEPIQRLDVLKTESISVESTMGERCQIETCENSSRNIELESHGDCSNNQTTNTESELFSTNEDMKITDSNLVADPAGISNCEEWKSESPCTMMADISKFVNIQKVRWPTKVVFLLDGRDFYLENEQPEDVKVARSVKLSFDNAISFLEKQQILGKGSLIIFCCGIFSVLTANVINVCKKKKCPNPLLRYSLIPDVTSRSLISKALNLQEYILNNTINDQVMFCELVPINTSSDGKKCGNNHCFQNEIPNDRIQKYLKAVEEYNNFVTEHSRSMGFKNLDILKHSFPSMTGNILSPDSLNVLDEMDKGNVAIHISGYIKELLQNMKDRWNKQSKVFDLIDEPSNENFNPVNNNISVDQSKSCYTSSSLSQDQEHLENSCEVNKYDKLVFENESILINEPADDQIIILTANSSNKTVVLEDTDSAIEKDGSALEYITEEAIELIEDKHATSEDSQINVVTVATRSDKSIAVEEEPNSHFLKVTKDNIDSDGEVIGSCEIIKTQNKTSAKFEPIQRLDVLETESISVESTMERRFQIETCENSQENIELESHGDCLNNQTTNTKSELFSTNEDMKIADSNLVAEPAGISNCEEWRSESPYTVMADFTKFINIQKTRCPTKIVFLLDGRDFYLDTEQLEDVKVARTTKLNFDNAITFLEKQQILGQGSLIIFCCGIFSFLTSNIVNVCKKKKCSNHLLRYSLIPDITTHTLISKALNLQEYILNNTNSDQIMFCELVPINISSDGKKCDNNHTFHNEISRNSLEKYLKTIEEFNKFVAEHSRSMGFKSFEILKHSFPSLAGNIFSPDSLNILDEMDKGNAVVYISDYIKELLQNMKDYWNKQSKIFDLIDEPSDENSNSLISNNSVNQNVRCNTSSSLCQDQEHLQNSNEVNIPSEMRCENENINEESTRINQLDDDTFITLTAKSISETVTVEDFNLATDKDSAVKYCIEKEKQTEDDHSISDDAYDNNVAVTISKNPIVCAELSSLHVLKENDYLDSDKIIDNSCQMMKTQNKTSAEFESFRSSCEESETPNTESFTRYENLTAAEIFSVVGSTEMPCKILQTSKTSVKDSEPFSKNKDNMRIADSNQAAVPEGESSNYEVNIQENRCPTKIILLLDGRDFYLEPVQPEHVKIARTAKLTFDNAISFLEKQQLLGQGSLIIFCCGIFSLLSSNVVNVCKRKKCPNHLLRYSLIPGVTSEALISKALNLQEYVLNNTTNDQVMFCELVPINISDDGKKCGNNHSLQNKIPGDILQKYLKTIEGYNEFVAEHSRSMGFKSFEILKHSFPSLPGTALSLDWFNVLDEMDMENVAMYISNYIKELLQDMKSRVNIHSELFDLTSSFDKSKLVDDDMPINKIAPCGTSSNLCQNEEESQISDEVNKPLELELVSENIINESNNQKTIVQSVDSTSKSSSKMKTLSNSDLISVTAIELINSSECKKTSFGEDVSFRNNISQSLKSKFIPGIAYIIALKVPKHDEISVTFDCVLCNPSSEIRLSGTEIKVHTSTKTHLLNVMEVDHHEMFDKYKDHETATSTLLYEALCNKVSSNNRIIAAPENYSSIRTILAKTISQLKKAKAEKATSDSLNEKVFVRTTKIETQSTKVARNNSNETRTLLEDTHITTLEYKEKSITPLEDKVNIPEKDVVNKYKKNINESRSKKKKMKEVYHSGCSVLYKPLLDTSFAENEYCFDSLSGSNVGHITAFQKVVLITYPQYLEYMNEFRLPWVEVVVIKPSSCGGLVSFIKSKVESYPSNTLWLTHSGIFNIANLTTSDLCRSSPCDCPLDIVSLYDEKLIESEKFLLQIHHYVTALTEEVNAILNPNSAFLILPPIPPTFLKIEKALHYVYHKTKQDRFYLSNEKGCRQLGTLFTALSKEITMLAISQLEKMTLSRHGIEEYFHATKDLVCHTKCMTYKNFIDASDKALNSQLRLWYKCIRHMIFLSVNEKDSPSSCRPTLQTNEISFPADSNVGELDNSSCDDFKDIDHIVFLGLREQLDLLPMDQYSSKLISLIELKVPFKREATETIITKLCSISNVSSRKNILFVFMASCKILCKFQQKHNFCQKENCEKPLLYFNFEKLSDDELITSTIDSVQRMLRRIKLLFKKKVKILLLPLFPIKMAMLSTTKTEDYHRRKHKSFTRANITCLVKERRRWNNVVRNFNKQWRGRMLSYVSDAVEFRNFIEQYFPAGAFPIIWWNAPDSKLLVNREAECFLIRQCKYFLRLLIIKILPSVTLGLTFKIPQNFFELLIVGNITPNQVKNLNTNQLLQYHKEFQRRCEIKKNKFNIKYEDSKLSEIINNIQNLRVLYNKMPFDFAYIISNKELETTVSNLETVQFICNESWELLEGDNERLLSLLGNIKTNSICILVLEIPHLSQVISISPTCSKFKCQKPISALISPVENIESDLDSTILKTFILNRISDIVTCISNLAASIPVVILPLFPARIYCDDGLSFVKHKLGHQIATPNSYTVIGNKDLWAQYARIVTDTWFDCLKLCYEKYFPSEELLNYIKENLRFLVVEASLQKFSSEFRDIFKWSTILRALTDVLVKNKDMPLRETQEESTNDTESSKGKEIIVVDIESDSSESLGSSCSKSRSRSRSRSSNSSKYRGKKSARRSSRSGSKGQNRSSRRSIGHKRSRSSSRNRAKSPIRSRRSSRLQRSRSKSPCRKRTKRSTSRDSHTKSTRESKDPIRRLSANEDLRISTETPSNKRSCSLSLGYEINKRRKLNTKVKLGPELYEEFNQEKEKLMISHREEYDKYGKTPELHSSYEMYYGEFCSEYMDVIARSKGGPQDWEKLWKDFWNNKVKIIEQQEWKRKEDELLSNFELKAEVLPAPSTSDTVRTNPSDAITLERRDIHTITGAFSIIGALSLLEQISGKLGILGQAMVSLSQSVKDMGPSSREAFTVLSDEENLSLVQMVMNKIQNLIPSTPAAERPVLFKALDWTIKLIEYGRNSTPKVTLNVNALAIVSLNKTTQFIFELIKRAFVHEGKTNPTKEEINEVYFEICSLQLKLTGLEK